MSSHITAIAASPPLAAPPSLAHHARLVLALGALAAAACARADASATNGADVTAPVPVVVQTVTPSKRAWSTTTSGIVQANTSVDVGFEVAGKVVIVGPDEGQPVRAGQEIAALDPTDYRLAVAQASALADRAARDRDRNQPLLAAGAIAPADMDHPRDWRAAERSRRRPNEEATRRYASRFAHHRDHRASHRSRSAPP